jgi:hypothetical protein
MGGRVRVGADVAAGARGRRRACGPCRSRASTAPGARLRFGVWGRALPLAPGPWLLRVLGPSGDVCRLQASAHARHVVGRADRASNGIGVVGGACGLRGVWRCSRRVGSAVPVDGCGVGRGVWMLSGPGVASVARFGARLLRCKRRFFSPSPSNAPQARSSSALVRSSHTTLPTRSWSCAWSGARLDDDLGLARRHVRCLDGWGRLPAVGAHRCGGGDVVHLGRGRGSPGCGVTCAALLGPGPGTGRRCAAGRRPG